MNLKSILYFCVLLSPINGLADNTEHHHHRALGAHEHGAGTLNIVMDNTILKPYFSAPAINLLGYEHKPTSKLEQQKLDSVLTQLKNSESILVLSGGDCTLSDYSITNPFDHDKAEADEHIHRDIDVEYSFVCQKPSELHTINISLFDSFSSFESLRTQWIMQSLTGGATFDHDQHLLKVR